MNKVKGKLIVIFTTVLLLTACTNNDTAIQPEPKDDFELTKLSVRGVTDQQPSDQAKAFLSQYEEVSGVRAVNHNGTLVIAVDLRHYDRLFLEDIEKALYKDLQRNFTKMQITLSTDRKIFLELERLEKDILDDKLSSADIKKRLNDIITLSKEQT